MFSANYLCRLAAPLSFNFLKLVNQVDSSFNKVMGEMDAFPFLGKEFTIFFPIFVAILCLFSLFKVWGKIGSMCCIKKLRYIPDDDIKLVSEGEKILRDERAVKEGRGPTNKSFKETIKGSIKSGIRKLVPSKDEEAPPPAPVAPVAAPTGPPKLADGIRMKYNKYEDGADMLPSSSKFASTSSSTTTTSVSNSSRGRNNYEDLLPATSRFASRNAAIIDVDDSSAKSFAKSTPMATAPPPKKSGFGSLFGNKNNKNDEVGLLGFSRSDSSLV
jgi:hypothetical protein